MVDHDRLVAPDAREAPLEPGQRVQGDDDHGDAGIRLLARSYHEWVRLLTVTVLALALASAAAARDFDRHGISFSYTAGWHVTTKPLSNVSSPTYRFAVATFEPRRTARDEGPCLAGIARQRGATGAYAYLLEDTTLPRRYLHRFPPRRLGLFHLPARGQQSVCDGRWSRWIPFRQAGRAFYLGISVGPKASVETRRQLHRILTSLEIHRRD